LKLKPFVKNAATSQDLNDLTSDNVLTAKDLGDDLVYCDRCKKQIEG